MPGWSQPYVFQLQQVSATFASNRLIRNTCIDIVQLAVVFLFLKLSQATHLALRGILRDILSFYLDVHETCELDIISAKFRRSSPLESFQNNPDLLVGTEYVP